MKNGSIAGGEKTTVQSAAEILENGGNAFDAAVGAVFTSMITECNLTGPGGGGALLACPLNEDPILFDFFVDTPLPQPDKALDFFSISIDFGPSQQEFHIGQGSVAVPGNTAGLLKVHERLGSLPLITVLAPAIETARKGVILNDAQGYLMKILVPILTHSKSGEALFTPNGNILHVGDRFKNPAFADFLEELITQGADYFYKGLGREYILNTVGEKGLLTADCLSNYSVVERDPLHSHFNGKSIYTNPAPSVGGSLITFTLQLMERLNTVSPTKLINLIHAMEVTAKVRQDVCNDPNDNYLISQILDENNFEPYLKQYNSFELENIPEDPPSRGATTQVSIIDKAGNAASVTTTNGEGCGYIIPELGVMLNNMLGEEDLNQSGFHNFIRQQRLPTMMSPTIIVGDAGPELVIGSGGSNRIRSAIIQVILNLTNGMNLDNAIRAPRMHLEGTTLHCEPGIKVPNKNKFSNSIHIHQWNEQNLFFGGVNAATRHEAVGDPRRDGAGIIY